MLCAQDFFADPPCKQEMYSNSLMQGLHLSPRKLSPPQVVITLSCHYSEIALQSECIACFAVSVLLCQQRHYTDHHYNKKTLYADLPCKQEMYASYQLSHFCQCHAVAS